jgi:ribosome-associated heat shock protein Hsp15
MRLDLWLWAVRLYKTRKLSVEAIKAGHVKVNGAHAKPAHEVKTGELITARIGVMTRTLKALEAPKSRVGAKLVAQHAEDLTRSEEFEKQREAAASVPNRPKGAGRPTKRERRRMLGGYPWA